MEDALFGLREGKWQLSLVSLRFLLLGWLPHGHRNALEQVRETSINVSNWLGISHLPIIQCLPQFSRVWRNANLKSPSEHINHSTILTVT